MKRFTCFGLAVLLLALCACGAGRPADQGENTMPPAPQGPGLSGDETLLALRQALLADGAAFSIVLGGEPDDTRRVNTTPELLAHFANALYYGSGILQAPGEVGAEIAPAPDALTIFSTEPYSSLGLAAPAENDTHCLLNVQLEGAAYQYLYPTAVYAFIRGQAERALTDNTLALVGEAVALQVPDVPADGTAQWMECTAGLAALYTWHPSQNSGGQASALAIFDTATGENLYFKELGARALRMEAASFSACDMRVVMDDGAMWYLNSQSPDVKPYYFYLPKALRDRLLAPYPQDRPVFRGFDGGTGQGALWAVVDEEGITWARRKAGETLANTMILENLPPDLYSSTSPAPQFGDVRLMNGGQTLVATVILPASQIGEAGIFTYHIASGAANWYFGMFRPMLADLRFLDDTRLCVAGDDEIFWLNVATGAESSTPSPPNIHTAATPDYENFVFTHTEQNPDGTETVTLTVNDRDTPLLAATAGPGGESALQTRGIIPRYLVVRVRDKGATSWRLSTLPQTGENP